MTTSTLHRNDEGHRIKRAITSDGIECWEVCDQECSLIGLYDDDGDALAPCNREWTLIASDLTPSWI